MDLRLKEKLLEELDAFVFFHLGSDAIMKVEDGEEGGIVVSVEHRRVHGFQFMLAEEQLRYLLEDTSRFEEFLLDYLATYRRS